jgi:hypothetical protein
MSRCNSPSRYCRFHILVARTITVAT